MLKGDADMYFKFKKYFNRGLQILQQEGYRSFFMKLKFFVREKIKVSRLLKEKQHEVLNILGNRFINISTIPTVYSTEDNLRLNIIIDTLNENSLYGGVATSIVFSIMLANQIGCPLRIITQDNGYVKTSVFPELAKIHHIQIPLQYEICSFPLTLLPSEKYSLPVTKKDIFISSSWWSSYVVKKINMRAKYIYLLQENEKIFYPNGDEHVMIDEIFNDNNMIPVINTRILQEYFVQDGYKHIEQNGFYFEPAFPYIKPLSQENFLDKKEKYNLLFYARPMTPRNLFYTGLTLLNDAIGLGIIKSEEWHILFAGDVGFPVKFCDGSKPEMLGKMTLDEYAQFIPNVDLCIGLMLAPCPSYIPLDLACAGSVVLTNTYKNKISLAGYSENILSAKPERNLLLKHLEDAVSLSKNSQKRYAHYLNNQISQSWEKSLSDVVTKLVLRIHNNLI